MEGIVGDLGRFSALIDLIYAGALDPRVWPEVLPGITEWMQTRAALLLTPLNPKEDDGLLFSHGFEQRVLELWRTKYQPFDVWTSSAVKKGMVVEGNCMLGTDLVPEDELKTTRWYQEFVGVEDIPQLMTGIVFDGRTSGTLFTVCATYRGEDQTRFDQGDLARHRLLVGHLSRALGVMYRLREAELRACASLAALDRLSVGVLLIAPPGDVVFANRAAHHILDSDDGLKVATRFGTSGGHLRATDPRVQAGLDAAIRQSVQGALLDVTHFSQSVAVPRPSGRQPYTLQFSALPEANEFAQGIATPRAIVFLSDPAEPIAVDPRVLISTYGLTPAESRLAIALADGGGLQETADQLAIGLNTAKSQLQNIYSKTGIDNRAKLTRLLVALAAGR